MSDVSITKLESGLLVPQHVAEEVAAEQRKVVQWTQDTWKKHRRTFRDYLDQQVSINLLCNKCKTRLTVVDLAPNKFSLRCTCTDRVITRGV